MEERRVISLENIKVACKNCSLNALCLPMGLTIEDVERLDNIVKRNRPLHRGRMSVSTRSASATPTTT